MCVCVWGGGVTPYHISWMVNGHDFGHFICQLILVANPKLIPVLTSCYVALSKKVINEYVEIMHFGLISKVGKYQVPPGNDP